MLLILLQYRLLHIQVHLLQAKKYFAFLQHLVKVNVQLEPGTRGARLGEEIPLGSIGTEMIRVMFRALLPKHMQRQ
jgi:hypothetical protein